MSYPKRLIEVDLPIKRISAHARREKSIRHGHISTLHIWWARRPLAACRAVVCASLWPDPGDAICPPSFVETANRLMTYWGTECLLRCSGESYPRFNKIARTPVCLDDATELRKALLDFIADFANWDNSTDAEYLAVARTLTVAAHDALEGHDSFRLPKSITVDSLNEAIKDAPRPLLVDPFAGGGAIPLEGLRCGADAFASDLNPVAVLLNRVVLEFIPKYGHRLAGDVRKWGQWVREQAQKELSPYYPTDKDGAIPIAYLWARTVACEGPGCGVDIPLVGRALFASSKNESRAFRFRAGDDKHVHVEIVNGSKAKSADGTCKGFVATCPVCGYSTPKKSVQRQLAARRGGADDSTLLTVLTLGPAGRRYREASEEDFEAFELAKQTLSGYAETSAANGLTAIPSEPIPGKHTHRAVGSQLPLYGFKSWGDLFNSRQLISILILQNRVRDAYRTLLEQTNEEYAKAIFVLLSFAIDKQADYLSSLCRWVSGGEFITGALAGEKKLSMISDFAEANPVGPGSGSWENHINWIARFLERESCVQYRAGTVCNASADDQVLPSDSASAMITDPPYYDSVPYADLSDFYYVWLKRTLAGVEHFPEESLTPKSKEMTVNAPNNADQKARYESLLTGAFQNGREVSTPHGIGLIVFAHKSTSGWETLLEAIHSSGWTITASWPIDTERSARPNAIQTASLASSVHIVCRPREDEDGRLITRVGDWRDVLAELPERIAQWLPRLSSEGVVGADAIFACLGPALEIFSRYSSVEKASGEVVPLREYLELVWAEVARQALNMIFEDADASGFEEDARLTAMWLWTLRTDANGNGDDDDKTTSLPGYSLEYDAARKIAQGLGCHLEKLAHLVEAKGETAMLLSAESRARYLFGKEEVRTPTSRRKKKDEPIQQDLFSILGLPSEGEAEAERAELERPPAGKTVLDQLHQAMLLFTAGRGQALKRFLVDDGIGTNPQFWTLAQALSALYPAHTNEKRWVDGVLARKKGLGF
ncbi:MAG: DUF1156 domain-containing protein [Candidatus Hydrogenedentes bacterium]|nr:DUF1156 domain-containing protein [Candidatus Hydrogenedentota bacterium]